MQVPESQEPSPKSLKRSASPTIDGRTYREALLGKPTVPNVPTIALSAKTTPKSALEQKPPPMFTTIIINGVPAKTLIDTGSSDDFIGNHFVTVNKIPVKKREQPLPIQQAVKGSKPKSNATALIKVEFGDWTKTLNAHAAGLAGYDAIIGAPTLHDGDAIISLRDRKVHFRAWGVSFDCTIPETPPETPNVNSRGRRARKRPKSEVNGIIALDGDVGGKDFPYQLPVIMATSASASTSEEKSSTRTRTRKGPKGFRNIRKNGDSNYYRELLLSEFDDILVDQLPNELPPLREINHRIPYKPTKPWIAHKYRLPEAHKQALERDVKAKLQSGILRYTSEIPLAASHMVPKHEANQFRHVQDLRKRNEDTEPMAWPLPDQEELVHKIARSSNASIFDMISAFDQTRVHPNDEKYATIINHMSILQQRTIQ
ncbi:MAG: hypothetical protein E6J34_19695 [Chloroflexi bacterium]|nr:MAG: hypothetical protein E6J34_19695 [Chloroflexota bacterium]